MLYGLVVVVTLGYLTIKLILKWLSKSVSSTKIAGATIENEVNKSNEDLKATIKRTLQNEFDDK